MDGIQRPTAQGGLLSVGVVESVSVCQYWISGIGGSHWPLQASSLLVGTSAAELIQDVVTAPTGTGPTVTDPRVCVPNPGGELIILRAHGSEHDQDVLVRYAGCKHNGTDDGSVLRALTSNAAKRIFIGPHAPDGKSNVLYQLLIGTPPPVV